MKMIGMSARSTATRFCKSRPLRPGRLTSRTRQLGTGTRGQDRNSCADSNVSGCQPAKRCHRRQRIRLAFRATSTITLRHQHLRDRLMSSYYPPFLECKRVVRPLPRPKSSIEGLQQSRIAEWFGQALHGALFEKPRTDALISVSRNEYDWDIASAKRQFPVEIGSGHPRHG